MHGTVAYRYPCCIQMVVVFANLGDKTERVIGTGIIGAELEDQWEDGVVLLFKRQDGT